MQNSSRPGQNPLAGILFRAAGASAFAVMAALIKLGHDAGVGTVELVFYRFAFGFPPLLLWIFWSGHAQPWRTQRPFAHAWRAVAGLVAMSLAFTALRYLPLAEATTISFAAPLFAVMLSALLLGEPVGRHRWSAVLLGLAGVFLVMRPAGETLPVAGLVIALLAALAVGIVTITIRQIGKTEHTRTTVLWFTSLCFLATGALMPFEARAHDASTWAILAGIGLAGGTGQLLITASLRFAPVSVIAPFDYVQLLWAVLLGWLLWDTHPGTTTWAGAAIIVASGLYTLYRERRLGRERPRSSTLL